jgi:hypothetical protein
MESSKLLFISLLSISYLFLSVLVIKMLLKKYIKSIDKESSLRIYLIGPLLICSSFIGYELTSNSIQLFDLINMSSKNIPLDLFKIGILALGISLFWFWIVFMLNKIIMSFVISKFNLDVEIKIENNSNLLIFAISLISICVILLTILKTLLGFLTPLNQTIIYH